MAITTVPAMDTVPAVTVTTCRTVPSNSASCSITSARPETPTGLTGWVSSGNSGFNPYFGLGVGPGFGYEKSEFADKGEWTQALVLSPRAGVELFECLRISVHYQWYLSNWSTFSHIGFGISWAFNTMGRGGRPMRR